MLPETKPGFRATEVLCGGSQFQEWKDRAPASNDRIVSYIHHKLQAGWNCDEENVEFSIADLLRLRISMRSFRRVLQVGEGRLWNSSKTNEVSIIVLATPFFFQEVAKTAGNVTDSSIRQLLLAPRYEGCLAHWVKSEGFARGETLDLANAAKEAICAVEALARVITGQHTATLGELVKLLKQSHGVDPAMAKALEGIWGFTSNSPGVRHGGISPAPITAGELQYVSQSSEAAIRFLLTLDR